MWECQINLSVIYKNVIVLCNELSVYHEVCTYYSTLLTRETGNCKDNIIISILTHDGYSSFSGSEFGYFETERGDELESLLHLIEELVFQKGGYNNCYIPLHASAVLNSQGEAILLIGETHSGKSTLLLYMVTHGYSFFADDLVLIDEKSDKLKFFPRPLHIRERTLGIFRDSCCVNTNNVYRLSRDSYFMKFPDAEFEPQIKKIIEVKYNEQENSLIELTGFEKILNITKNLKGTNIANWQKNISTFVSIPYLRLKYCDFDYIDTTILKEG